MRLSAAELEERARRAALQYADCLLCGHRCRVDRTGGPAGFCQEGSGAFLAGAGVHFGEERALVGEGWGGARPRGEGRRGSGLVLLGGCNLACRFCETADFSLERKGLVAADAAQLGALFLDLQARGAANVNLVTPTHVLPALLAGLARAAAGGFALPVVWNCGGYETREALELLDGVVDVYLPDAKVGSDEAGERLLGCRGYTGALGESLREMQRQTGPLLLEGGLARRGTIVRALVLPGDAGALSQALPLVAECAPDAVVNVMSQYRPLHQAGRLPVIARRCTREEVERTVAQARAAGVREVWVDGAPRTDG